VIDFTKYIERALREVRRKSLRQVQVETAQVWFGRAVAAAQLGHHEDAIEYAHEAIEHAALSGHDELLWAIREELRLHGLPL